MPSNQIRSEITKYLRPLHIDANVPARHMSGTMRRQLSVCVALCGRASIVLLDEPTAEMAPCARQALWRLLLREKCDRTILLATASVAEADSIGDRIAVLSNGRLLCCGSPQFLKLYSEPGFRLACEKAPLLCDEARLMALLVDNFQTVRLLQNTGTELLYALNDEISEEFAPWIDKLECNLCSWGLRSFAFSSVTLKEVVLAAEKAHGAQHQHVASVACETKNITKIAEPNVTCKMKINGYGKRRFQHQAMIMMRKKIAQINRNILQQLLLHGVIPIVIAGTFILMPHHRENLPALVIKPSVYDEETLTYVFDEGNGTQRFQNPFSSNKLALLEDGKDKVVQKSVDIIGSKADEASWVEEFQHHPNWRRQVLGAIQFVDVTDIRIRTNNRETIHNE